MGHKILAGTDIVNLYKFEPLIFPLFSITLFYRLISSRFNYDVFPPINYVMK